MGRGGTISPESVLFGDFARAKKPAAKAVDPEEILPAGKFFRATLHQLQLKSYLSGDQEGDLSGWCGGKAWLALGTLPDRWIFRSAEPTQSDDQWSLTTLIDSLRQRVEVGEGETCKLDSELTLDRSRNRGCGRRILIDGTPTKHVVKADHVDAARRVLAKQGRVASELRLIGDHLLCLDAKGEMVALFKVHFDAAW